MEVYLFYSSLNFFLIKQIESLNVTFEIVRL